MGIKINITYQTVTPESAEIGEPEETGFKAENVEYTFRELVELLHTCEHSGSSWATHYCVDEDYATGAITDHSYHPVSNRDARYFEKAARVAGILH